MICVNAASLFSVLGGETYFVHIARVPLSCIVQYFGEGRHQVVSISVSLVGVEGSNNFY